MGILGIDYEICDTCKSCVSACSRHFRYDREEQKVIFADPENTCSKCGRCLARCPNDAILNEEMGELMEYDGVQDPGSLVEFDTLFKFMSANRSMRGYKKKKVSKEIMEKVLNAMRYAPTGGNMRLMEITIISDEDEIKKLSTAVVDGIIASNNPGYSDRFKEAKKTGYDPIFYQAPHVMIVHSDFPGQIMNSTIALTYGMFAAESLGLGSCWIGLAQGVLEKSKEVKENIAGVKNNVFGVITLGYPTQKYFKVPSRPPIKTYGLDNLE